MFNLLATAWLRRLGGTPCFRIWGKARRERDWHVLDVFATQRRNADSRWPRYLWRGTCITWTASVIAVGWDFAEEVLREQLAETASRERPVEVAGGRIRDPFRRAAAGAEPWATASEVLAHECGHTRQAWWLDVLYYPVVGTLTLFREGNHFWNHFENNASEQGLFGGIVNGSVCARLMERVQERPV